jgi:peptide/nickel transport system permease protein
MPLTASFGLLVILLYISSRSLPRDRPLRRERGSWRPVLALGIPPLSLGTDKLGRDMLSRLIYGARNTVGIAFATTALAFFVGSVLGLWAALVGGWLDQVVAFR